MTLDDGDPRRATAVDPREAAAHRRVVRTVERAGPHQERDLREGLGDREVGRVGAGREDLGCLVFAPLDQAERDSRGRIQTMATMHDIVAAQRAAAFASGCAFFDTWTAMGGEGAMETWYQSRPRLAMADFRHATPAGYEVIGNLFYKALLAGFAEHLGDASDR